jgi:hypothetical protein
VCQYVLRLDVAVDDIVLEEVFEAVEQLLEVKKNLLLGPQPPLAS